MNDSPALIADADVRKLCGGVSRMTLTRWEKDPDLSFPDAVVIAGRKYRRADELRDWIATRQRGGIAKPSFLKKKEAA